MCITESCKNVGNDQNVSNVFLGGYKICNLLYWFYAISNAPISITLPSFSRNLSKMTFFCNIYNYWLHDSGCCEFSDIFFLTFLGKSLIGNEIKSSLSILRSNNWMRKGTIMHQWYVDISI